MIRVLPAVALLVLAACGGASGASDGSRPLVVAALYPLGFVASTIAGAHAEVIDLTPAGVEPHDIELKPSQVQTLADADLVLYVGEGFQPAVQDIISELPEGGAALDVLSEQRPIETSGGVDPHIWLDPVRLADVARLVAGRLAAIDPAHAEEYRSNAARLQRALDELDSAFKSGLRRCERRDIVVAHEAFGYLAERYRLDQVGISGLDPEAEPSPQHLADVSRFVEEHDVATIFFERLAPPDLAQTIARDLGVDTAVLDPLESAPATGDYLSAMRANLSTLGAALGCAR